MGKINPAFRKNLEEFLLTDLKPNDNVSVIVLFEENEAVSIRYVMKLDEELGIDARIKDNLTTYLTSLLVYLIGNDELMDTVQNAMMRDVKVKQSKALESLDN
jgi:hypothetical protein